VSKHWQCSGCGRDVPGSKGGFAAYLGTLKCQGCVKREVEAHAGAVMR
jgi:hypothetical protein